MVLDQAGKTKGTLILFSILYAVLFLPCYFWMGITNLVVDTPVPPSWNDLDPIFFHEVAFLGSAILCTLSSWLLFSFQKYKLAVSVVLVPFILFVIVVLENFVFMGRSL